MIKFIKMILAIISVLAILFIVLWFVMFVAGNIIYREYLSGRERVCRIPELNCGFTAQGITYIAETGGYIQSGYNRNGLALYYVNGSEIRGFVPLSESGEPEKGHGGGVTHAGDFVYVAGDESLVVYSLSELLEADNGASLECKGRVLVDNSASFCFSDGHLIYVGEFYRAGNYETSPDHAYTTPEGEERRAIVSCYRLNDDGSFASDIPEYRISVPELVQGFAVKDGVIALSRSWGLNSSVLEFYNGMIDSGEKQKYGSSEIPLYYVGSTNLINALTIPAFSEDMTTNGESVVISFESASNKYIVGKLFNAYYANSYPFPKN